MRKVMTVLGVSTIGAVALAGTVRLVSGVEDVLDPLDKTNGGFWDTAYARTPTQVNDGSASIDSPIDASGGVTGTFERRNIDIRAFAWDYSDPIALRTDPPRGFSIIIR